MKKDGVPFTPARTPLLKSSDALSVRNHLLNQTLCVEAERDRVLRQRLVVELHTPGGLVLAATQIARAIFTRKGKVTVFVPHYAMSGGTLLALAADEIVMSDYAVLGPVDPQLGEYPAASILKAAHQKPVAEVDDKTLILADQAEKAIAQMRHEVGELLADRYPREKAEETAKLMTSGTWTHDYPITCERARALGLPVNSNMPENVLRLMELYPQPMRRQPSVEYVPVPYRSDRRATPK